MKFFKKASAAISLASIILGSQATFASMVPINNPSFEDPVQGAGGFNGSIPGWNQTGQSGVWNPIGWGPYAFGAFNYIPDGAQIGYLNSGTVSQTLGTDVLPNTTYTLSIYVGNRTDYDPGTAYSIGLYVGGSPVAWVTPAVPTPGNWVDLTATYTSGPMVPLSTPLGIYINYGTQGQLNVDDVTLNTGLGTAVPEPSTMIAGAMLLLPFGSGAVRLLRKKLQAA